MNLIHRFLEDIAAAHLKGTVDMNGDGAVVKIGALSSLLAEFNFVLDPDFFEFKIAFDGELLTAALREVLREIRTVSNTKWEMSIFASPVPQWTHAGYVVITFHAKILAACGSGWTIARYIIEWHGGQLHKSETDVHIILPLLETTPARRVSA